MHPHPLSLSHSLTLIPSLLNSPFISSPSFPHIVLPHTLTPSSLTLTTSLPHPLILTVLPHSLTLTPSHPFPHTLTPSSLTPSHPCFLTPSHPHTLHSTWRKLCIQEKTWSSLSRDPDHGVGSLLCHPRLDSSLSWWIL